MKPYLLLFLIACCSCTTQPPKPVMPIPSQDQLNWQEMEFYAFVHFNINTFTNMEWGLGDENPDVFDPTELDCRQWARVCKEAGMKGIILTVKHHDGFCLWPSQYTEHSVKNSKWKEGKGDVVQELADACKEYGLKLGIYYSPWDRNHPDYGKPAYLTYMRNQLGELLTNYGDVFEVWFDGANGGTGYYGGANENRKIDNTTYYDWSNTHALVRELQPHALMFSDAGPDIRWVGNEDGHAFRTMWSNLERDSVYPGMIEYSEKYASGQENGSHWVPGETNVSIRPGWYYHEYEDHKVKSLKKLVDMYYESIGRNTTFLLNFPVDKRGLIHESDILRLQDLTSIIHQDFATELAKGLPVMASTERGPGYPARFANDGGKNTYWATPDGITEASWTLTFEKPTLFNRFLIQEYIALGQRVKSFSLEARTHDGWQEIASETTIGYKRILRFPDVTAHSIRLRILDAKACPLISNIEIYHAPKLMVPPTLTRSKSGQVSISNSTSEGIPVFYTLDGSKPNKNSMPYTQPFDAKEPVVIMAIAIDTVNNRESDVTQKKYDIAKTTWVVMNGDPDAQKIIDESDLSWWALNEKNEITIDLGDIYTLTGFTYTPMQDRWIKGFIKDYEFFVSTHNKKWKRVAKGEFGNIMNSPIQQRISFKEKKARYIKLKAVTTVDGNPASFAEIGVLTE